MFSPTISQAVAQQHRRDLLRDAAQYRLRRLGRAASRHRVRLAVGGLLVSAGVWVAGRPQPAELPRLRPFLM